MEPYGRICIGVLELIAGVLLLIPKTIWVGASTTIGLMVGAIFMHLTKIGIIVNNDNGVLFITAVLTLVLSAIVLYSYRSDIPLLENQKE